MNTITMPDGKQMVFLSREEYARLLDETFSDDEVDEYLAAPSALAFYRKRRGLTRSALAEASGVSQAYLAQLELRRRVGSVAVLASLARVLRVQIDDLVPDGSAAPFTRRCG